MKIHTLLIILMISTAIVTGCFDDEEEKNHKPKAKAEVDKVSVLIGEEIKFDASNSKDEDGDELFFTWDFDDSNGQNDTDSSNETVTYTYWDAGDGEKKYIVTLTVSDGEFFDTDEITITVKKPPSKYVCKFDVDIKYGEVNETEEDTIAINENKIIITFNASGCSDTDGKVVSYEWDFSFDQSEDFKTDKEGVEVKNEFKSGLYPVMLKIENDKGEPNTDLQYIKVDYKHEYKNLSLNQYEEESINFPINTLGLEKVVVTLTYDDGRSSFGYIDMDLYVYNTSADNQSDDNEIGRSDEHDTGNETQINVVLINNQTLFNKKENVVWSSKVVCRDLKSGDANYDLVIEVYYKKKL